jgi:hypothetical protein
MPIVVQERTLWWVLFSAAAVVSVLGLIAELVHQIVPSARSPVLPMFSLSVEANFPTWYSSLLLAACGVLLFAIAAGVRQSQGPFYRRWALLGAVFVYMSLDEAVELHEHLGEIVDLHGVLYFSWVVPAGILVLLLGLSYLPFLKHLPKRTRWRFVLAGAIYVGGALVLELPLGWWAERAGRHNVVYGLLDWVEETMEIVGATLFLLSLLGYLREQYGGLRLAPREGACPCP